MFTTKSGQKFGSAFVGKKKDAMGSANKGMGDTPAHEAAETPEFEKGEQEGAKEGQEGMQEAPEQIVKEHGPATTVHISHDHKSGKHHVVSTHPDGHVHTSDHATAGEAHAAAGKLSGADQPPAEGEGEGMGAAPEAPESDGFPMPRLA